MSAGLVASGTISPNNRKSQNLTAQVVRSDAEALEIVTGLAATFREKAVRRDRERILPYEEIDALTKAGIFGITVPRRYGGADVSAETVAEVFRILAAADPNIGQIPQNHFCWLPVVEKGTPEQAEFFFGKFLAGERIGNAHSEDTRRKPGDYEHKLEKVDGGWRVTGRKYYSTGALFAHWIPFIAHFPDEEIDRCARMIELGPQPSAALLLQPVGSDRVNDLVPGLQNCLVIGDACFRLLCRTKFEHALEPRAVEDRQGHAWPSHVLQRARLEQVVEVEGIEADTAVELKFGIERSDGDADIGGSRVQLIFGLADVGSPARELGRNPQRYARRRARNGTSGNLGVKRSRRQVEQ